MGLSSRDLNLLHPDLQVLARRFLTLVKAEKVDCVISCTYRDYAEQNRLYDSGRSTIGRIVTNARGGESAHNCMNELHLPASRAFDIAVFEGGIYATNKNSGWQVCGKVGTDLGLEWLGSKDSKFFELAHFQLKNWRNYGN
jgi:peptidoglycan L-alanyl-D-glutamate endopeptidase CwlK